MFTYVHHRICDAKHTHTLTPAKKIPSIVVCLWASKIWDDVSVSAFKSRHFYSFLHGLICIFTISLAFFGVISYCWHTLESQFNSEHNSNDCLLAVTGWNKIKKNCSLHISLFTCFVAKSLHLLSHFNFKNWHIAMKINFLAHIKRKISIFYVLCVRIKWNDF